jgi:REP element-mobilizing transposase RayT
MSQGYQIYDQNKLYYLTFQIVQWIDVFTRNEYKQIIVNSFDYCRQHKGLELYAYVIMTNHLHLIVRAKEPFHLSDIIRDFKKFTANQLLPLMQQPTESRSDWMMKRFEFSAKLNARNRVNQMWTHENHAIELFTPKFTQQKLDCIHNNPVRAGIVEKPEDYLYSSARNYAGLKAMCAIDFL